MLAAVWLASDDTGSKGYTQTEQLCAAQKGQYPLPSELAARTERGLPTQYRAPDADKGTKDQPDYCDLAAQESMAKSTASIEWATWLTTIFTGIAVVLVWFTLKATRETVREARAATRKAGKAAEAANAANALVGYEQRPWVILERNVGCHFDLVFAGHSLPDINARVALRWTYTPINRGRTPAFDMRIFTDIVSCASFGEAYGAFHRFVGEVEGMTHSKRGRAVFPSASEGEHYGTIQEWIKAPEDEPRWNCLFAIVRYRLSLAPNAPFGMEARMFHISENANGLRPGNHRLIEYADYRITQ